MRKALGATVQAIAVTVETRDPYTAGHQRRVADLARSIATEMKLPVDQIDGIRMALPSMISARYPFRQRSSASRQN